MIKIEISLAVALYISLSIFLVISAWIFYNYNRKEKNLINDAMHLEQCRFCAHVFFNYLDKEILICPLCKSYIQANRTSQHSTEKGKHNVKTTG